MIAREETRKLTQRQRDGRAINAVAELLRRKLSVPNIYLEPPSSLISADILAVDRGGAGDLHAVEIKLGRDLNPLEGQLKKPSNPKELNALHATWYPKYSQKLHSIHRQLMSMPAHYRYLAIPEESFNLAFGELGRLGLFPEDGIGSLGIIAIREMGEEPPTAQITIVPERFRVDPAKLKAIETRLLAKSRPDIEVRI
ncbi:MAG TPA: hypothetical protein VHX20_18950 [Terracidiphilus sp.]|jgi:hypothetical protein|nr:hypothetical protein [Terracidiphilus sp.]